jgi:hypothetical protein
MTFRTYGYRAWLMTVSEGAPFDVPGLGPVEARIFELNEGEGLPSGWFRHPGKVFEAAESEAVLHPATHTGEPAPKRRGRPRKTVIDATNATITTEGDNGDGS